jgi:hypothetical protein
VFYYLINGFNLIGLTYQPLLSIFILVVGHGKTAAIRKKLPIEQQQQLRQLQQKGTKGTKVFMESTFLTTFCDYHKRQLQIAVEGLSFIPQQTVAE